jgi:hypothetical protein
VQFSRLHAEHKLVQNTIGKLIFFYLSLFVCILFFFANQATLSSCIINYNDWNDYRLILSVKKTWLFCWNSWKNNDRGANKSLIIHKTSQNNRNNIIWSCIWVYLGKKSHRLKKVNTWSDKSFGLSRCVNIVDAIIGSINLPQNTTKTNWILHKHLNKHRNNEQMWNLCFYVYLFIIKQKYWRVNQRAITQLIIYSCRIKHILSGIVYFICFKCIYLSFCCSWLLLILKLTKTEKCIH